MSTADERDSDAAATRRDQPEAAERGAHNEIGFRNVDEEASHGEDPGDQTSSARAVRDAPSEPGVPPPRD